jgi:hypothetical protein
MRSFTNRLAVFAASAVVLGTMAYGQTTMKAEIPFAFHTANATLPAGTYTINQLSGVSATTAMRLFDTATHRSVVAVSLPADIFRTAAERPSIVFACTGEKVCTLREIKTGNGTYSYPAAHQLAREREAVSMIEIPLSPRNGV